MTPPDRPIKLTRDLVAGSTVLRLAIGEPAFWAIPLSLADVLEIRRLIDAVTIPAPVRARAALTASGYREDTYSDHCGHLDGDGPADPRFCMLSNDASTAITLCWVNPGARDRRIVLDQWRCTLRAAGLQPEERGWTLRLAACDCVRPPLSPQDLAGKVLDVIAPYVDGPPGTGIAPQRWPLLAFHDEGHAILPSDDQLLALARQIVTSLGA